VNRRVTANAAVLAALRLGAPLCSLAMVASISRALGSEGLGRYSLAYAYLGVFGLLGPLGLPTLVTREGARDPASLGRLLSSGLAIGGAASILLTAAMAAMSAFLDHDAATARALLVLSAALLPSTGLACFEAAFLALERTAPIAVSAVVENAFKVAGGMALLRAGYGLEAVLAAAVAGRAAACALSIALLRGLGVQLTARADFAVPRRLARAAPVFALSGVCAALYWRIDLLLLARLRGLAEVGHYSAAYRILDLAILAPQSLCHSLFPRLASGRAPDTDPLRWLFLLTAPVAAAVTATAGPLLRLLYGPGFEPASPVLSVLIWTALPYAWNRYYACVLVAAGRQRADLAINASLLAVTVLLNLAFIPRFGATGAAVVTLATALLYGAAQRAYLQRLPAPAAAL